MPAPLEVLIMDVALNQTDVDVLIAGAGPTGLAMAAEAARFGLRYRIIDKAPHGALHSQALAVQARTLEQFERYDLAERAIALGRKIKRFRLYSDGKRLVEASFDDLPCRYPFVLFLPQTQTEALLTDHVEIMGGHVEREIELYAFTEHENGLACELRAPAQGQSTVTCAYLIGADGAHSTVRKLLGMPFGGQSDAHDFFLGDLRVQGDVPDDEVALHLHHGNVVFFVRLDRTHCRFVVALHGQPMEREPAIADFQAAVDMAGIENLRVSDPRWMTRFRVSARRTPAYSRGRVFLAGDATNIHSPVGGQGMNTGIQDAANLIWKIALAQSQLANHDLLESYDRERKPISDALLRTTGAGLRAATAANWLVERLRDMLLARIAPLHPVQDRLRGVVSEIGIHYRQSPIVRDAGGSSPLRAGDRAPDCEVLDETGTRFQLFDLIREPLHTLLAIMPKGETMLTPLAQFLAEYHDVMQGAVLVDGDDAFKGRYAGGQSMIYVIRPDGYIGFRGSCPDLYALEEWARSVFVKRKIHA